MVLKLASPDFQTDDSNYHALPDFHVFDELLPDLPMSPNAVSNDRIFVSFKKMINLLIVNELSIGFPTDKSFKSN